MKSFSAVFSALFACLVLALSMPGAPGPGHGWAETSIGNKFRRALRQISAGNLNEAKTILAEIDGLNPFIAEVKNNLGYVYERLGDSARAREFYEKALEIKPGYAEALNNLGYLTAVSGGDLAKAEEMVTGAVTAVPENKFFRDSLGTVLSMKGDRERARIQFEKALLLDPDYIPARQNLARLLFDAGNFQGCLGALEKLENSPEIVFLKYRCLKGKGDYTGAFATLRELKALLDKGGLPVGVLGPIREEAEAFLALSVAEAGRRILEARGLTGPAVTMDQIRGALPPEAGNLVEPFDGDFFAASIGLMTSASHGLNPVLFEKSARANEIAARAVIETSATDALLARVLATAAALTGEAATATVPGETAATTVSGEAAATTVPGETAATTVTGDAGIPGGPADDDRSAETTSSLDGSGAVGASVPAEGLKIGESSSDSEDKGLDDQSK